MADSEANLNRIPDEDMQYPPNPSEKVNSAYVPGNPDFDPSKDMPQARGCDTMFDIISNT